MDSCFENYIGIKSCDLTTSKTGKYLEDLGISISKLANVTNEAIPTGKEYGLNKIQEAIDFVLADIQNNYNETPLIASLNELGVGFTTYSGNISFTSTCNEARVRIDRLFANAETNIDTTLYIQDGSETTEINFNTADEIEVNYQSTNKKLIIYIEDVNYVPANMQQDCTIHLDCCNDVLVSQGTTGLEVDYSLVCTKIDCKIANDKNFQLAVLYYTGVLISQDLRLSSNLNEVVRYNNAEKEVDREDIWMATYEKYAQKARQTFEKIIDNSCCKDCDRYKVNYYI